VYLSFGWEQEKAELMVIYKCFHKGDETITSANIIYHNAQRKYHSSSNTKHLIMKLFYFQLDFFRLDYKFC